MAECQEVVDSAEFTGWQEADKIEPIGRDWLQAGIICATFANFMQGYWGSKKGKRKAWKPEDFMPLIKEAARKQTGAEMEAVFRQATMMHTATMKGRRG